MDLIITKKLHNSIKITIMCHHHLCNSILECQVEIKQVKVFQTWEALWKLEYKIMLSTLILEMMMILSQEVKTQI
jgi:hypothetical protein